MTNSVTIYDEGQVEIMTRIATAMTKSNFFGTDIPQAFVKILAGREIGFEPFASMAGIHVIKGKPSLSANSMAVLVKKHPNYDYRVVEMTDKVCRLRFFQDSEEIGTSEFSAQDAQKAGTQNMHKFPRNMLFARAMSNGVKWFVPDVMFGLPVYTPEELGANVDEDGDIVDFSPDAVIVTQPEEKKDEVTEATPEKADTAPEQDTTQEPPQQIDEGLFEEVEKVADEVGAEVTKEPDKLTDGEQVIYEAGTTDYVRTLIALIDRYQNVHAVKNALKKLNQTGWPRGADHAANMRRVKQYRLLRDHATEMDAAETKNMNATEQQTLV